MKTSVEIDEKKVKLAKQLSKTETLREVIDKALDEFIARARQLQMLEMLGSDFFSGDLNEMRGRAKRGRTHR